MSTSQKEADELIKEIEELGDTILAKLEGAGVKVKFVWKCRECGSVFSENEKLPMKANPSGILQEHCGNCYGVLDLVPEKEAEQS